MPRIADGLPTNTELMTMYETMGRDVFTSAYERSFSEHLPPAFEDKPLESISLTISRGFNPTVAARSVLNPVVSEHLNQRVITNGGFISEHLRWKDMPELVDHRQQICRSMAGLLLTADFNPHIIAPEVVLTEYVAQLLNSRRRSVMSQAEKPTKQTIYGALGMLEDTQQYIASKDYDKPESVRLWEYAKTTNPTGVAQPLTHHWKLEVSADLPLNGHESPEFLLDFLEQMVDGAERVENRLERLQTLDVPKVLIDREKDRLARYMNAAKRAVKYLPYL